VTDKIWNCFM